MEIKCAIQPIDLAIARQVSVQLLRSKIRLRFPLRMLNWLAWFFGTIAVLIALELVMSSHGPFDGRWALLLFVLATVSAQNAGRILSKRTYLKAELRAQEPFPVEFTISLGESGISVADTNSTLTLTWAALHSVRKLHSHVAIVIRPCNVIAVPDSAFKSTTAREDFIAFVRSNLPAP